MTRARARRPRALIGDLEPFALLGVSRLLADGGVDVVAGAASASVLEEATSLRPDAVVLRLDEAALALGAQIQDALPATKVLLMASDESELHALDPGGAAPRRIVSAVPDALVGEIVSCTPVDEE